MQFHQRIGHLVELVGDALDLVDVTARQAGPSLFGDHDALSRLRQQQRVEPAEMAGLVVHRLVGRQRPCQPHRSQRRRVGRPGRDRLRAEKHQVLRQPVRHCHLAFGQRCVLHEHPRCGALHVDVHRQQALRQRLEVATCNFPENTRLPGGLRSGQAQTQCHQIPRGLAVAGLDHRQHALVHTPAHSRVVDQRFGDRRRLRLDPAPVQRPEIGRVHAIGAGQLLRIPVLRKQCDSRNRLAEQQPFQVLGQCKSGSLEFRGRRLAAQLGPLDELLYRGFHAAKHVSWRAHADHFQRTDGLVQLLARDSQLAVIDGSHVGAARLVGITHKPAQRGRRAIE